VVGVGSAGVLGRSGRARWRRRDDADVRGDLRGLAERLGQVEDLGANALWLTPIFPAESNHRYNASTFDRVDPLLGGDAALVEPRTRGGCTGAQQASTISDLEPAHARGMHLVGDLTPNHSDNTHDWFQAAQADPDSIEAGFYRFRHHPDDYWSWPGEPTLPTFDHRSPELRRRLWEGPDADVARWLRGPSALDGWRIDVANMIGRRRRSS